MNTQGLIYFFITSDEKQQREILYQMAEKRRRLQEEYTEYNNKFKEIEHLYDSLQKERDKIVS